MDTNKEAILNNYTKKNNLIFYFVFDHDGNVLDYNNFASDFIKHGAPIFHIREIFVDFHSKINLEALSEDSGKEHIFSINGFAGVPESFYFTFYRLGKEFLVLGRLDVLELESFHTKLIELNNELSNISRELQKSNAELKKLNELKNTFLGMAVHDLRKPVTVIKGYTRLLMSGAADKQPERTKEFLTAIDNATLSMQSIINNFLDLSVIDSGKLKLSCTQFSINDCISDMLALNRMKAENRKIRLIIETGGADIKVMADKEKLQQVLDNIAGNAIEYTPNGGTVTVRVAQDGYETSFSVEDEGPGIPESFKDNLFKAFGKTGVIKASGEKSTGLGLLISKKIIEEHGGTIGAENRPGKGAKFTFTLPLNIPGGSNG